MKKISDNVYQIGNHFLHSIIWFFSLSGIIIWGYILFVGNIHFYQKDALPTTTLKSQVTCYGGIVLENGNKSETLCVSHENEDKIWV